ncbi:MAG: EAL domain-containing protein [Pseudomonas sp.]|uniref:EAL domain-containing protein n=1 Tax=Pseudomonas abieticivorans TaxID=2931382 RepID=UPI0020C0286B|nr:EAL domain-containing protein [Pseudomonas sp. PIA16]MDE1167892.1 EAL domain-containing protein [Pseudomonas sp.]
MNASQRFQLANDTDFYLSRQLILKRDDRPLGSEIRILLEQQPRSLDPGTRLSSNKLACIYSEMLMHTQLMAFALKGHVKPLERTFSRRFVCIAQPDLADPALLEELIQSGEMLRNHGQTLVVSTNALAPADASFKHKKKIIKHVYLLKDHAIELALDHHNPHHESFEILTTLDVFDYIKIPFSSLDLSLKLNTNPDEFNQLYDRMSSLKQRTHVSFIADNVEHTASHLLARALPFDFFQGSYYSPADPL